MEFNYTPDAVDFVGSISEGARLGQKRVDRLQEEADAEQMESIKAEIQALIDAGDIAAAEEMMALYKLTPGQLGISVAQMLGGGQPAQQAPAMNVGSALGGLGAPGVGGLPGTPPGPSF